MGGVSTGAGTCVPQAQQVVAHICATARCHRAMPLHTPALAHSKMPQLG